jgi:hypothetical protein
LRDLPIHSAAEIMPRPTDDEFHELAVNIKANGIREDDVLHRDQDGMCWVGGCVG